MPFIISYKHYMGKIQEAYNELEKVDMDIVNEQSKEAKAIRDVIKQIGVMKDALRELFDRLEPANKYYGQEGEIKPRPSKYINTAKGGKPL